jgi:hypothetical protein
MVTVFAANHLSLIRSFLIDSGLCTPRRETNCAKIFALHKRAVRSKFCARNKLIRENSARVCAVCVRGERASNPYFIVIFLISELRARCCDVHASNNIFSRGTSACARMSAPNARPHTRFVKRTLFFSLCCSKRNAVRVDSRRALMRHPPCYMARRAANGET